MYKLQKHWSNLGKKFQWKRIALIYSHTLFNETANDFSSLGVQSTLIICFVLKLATSHWSTNYFNFLATGQCSPRKPRLKKNLLKCTIKALRQFCGDSTVFEDWNKGNKSPSRIMPSGNSMSPEHLWFKDNNEKRWYEIFIFSSFWSTRDSMDGKSFEPWK